MKRVSWKYLAGLVDGEGCVDLLAQKTGYFYIQPRLRIGLVESSRYLLEILKLNHGGSLYLHDRQTKYPTWQNLVTWELVGYAVTNGVLRNIVNHLFLKKEQARLCLWMNEHIKGRHISQKVLTAAREELSLMKRDPHRLSETAQTKIWDAIVETAEIAV